jgi:hypothetical protein
MAFVVYGKIKDAEVNHAILDCLHMVMFMSINPRKTIESLKVLRREKVVETFNTLILVMHGINFLGLLLPTW